jgi:hypothetical protein
LEASQNTRPGSFVSLAFVCACGMFTFRQLQLQPSRTDRVLSSVEMQPCSSLRNVRGAGDTPPRLGHTAHKAKTKAKTKSKTKHTTRHSEKQVYLGVQGV